jgi:glycosyltransferase involved in cell wall biosynthesis
VGIRGFSILLDAMVLISDINITLKVLARKASNEQLSDLRSEVFRRGLESRVSIEGGWMDVAALRSELQSARVVLLPFVLVPSELPVSVMEAVACGSPVVVTNIDGLPDAAGAAGLVIPNGDVRALADALMLIRYDQDKYEKLKSACQPQRESMMSWDEMSCKWLELLSR